MRLFPRIDLPVAIFFVVMCLVTIGTITVYSASAPMAGREHRRELQKQGELTPETTFHGSRYLMGQIRGVFLGLILMAFFYHFDYSRLKKYAFYIMAGCFVLCAMVWLPGIGIERKGAHRWINLGIQFQPSELAKLGVIIYMARMLDERRRFIQSFVSGVVPAVIIAGAFLVIIVLEPDYGAAAVLGLVILGMWFCAEMKLSHLFGLSLAGLPPAALFFLMEPYRLRRLVAFRRQDDPDYALREGYQLKQSLIAIGSGGLTGAGLGKSIQKYQYLAEGHTDFIFGIIGEELGFVGCSIVLLLFVSLIILGWKVALNTPDLFGSLLATGITLEIFLGVSINLAVVLGLAPTKGLVLPFLSYGSTSMMVMMATVGILMNVARLQRGMEVEAEVPALPARRT